MATRAAAAAAVRAAGGAPARAARAAETPTGASAIPTGSRQASAVTAAAAAAAATGGVRRWWPATAASCGRAGLASAAGAPPFTPAPPSPPCLSTSSQCASPVATDAAATATATGGVGGDADPQAVALRTAVAATTDALMGVGWTNTEEDVDELLVVVEEGDAALDAYRSLYAAGAGATTHPVRFFLCFCQEGEGRVDEGKGERERGGWGERVGAGGKGVGGIRESGGRRRWRVPAAVPCELSWAGVDGPRRRSLSCMEAAPASAASAAVRWLGEVTWCRGGCPRVC